MEQPKDFVELKEEDSVLDLTHKDIIILRVINVVIFFLGFLAGSVIW